jgi:hypothetical protein
MFALSQARLKHIAQFNKEKVISIKVDAMMASLKSVGIDVSDTNDIVKKSITSLSVQSRAMQ